jgi:hypothetical protein
MSMQAENAGCGNDKLLTSELAAHWRRINIRARPGVPLSKIEDFEVWNSVLIPVELRNFYLFANGTDGGDVSECLFEMLPIEKIWRFSVEDEIERLLERHPRSEVELVVSRRFRHIDDVESCFVIADLMLDSEYFIINLSPRSRTYGGIYEYVEGHLLFAAPSFETWLRRYLRDPFNGFFAPRWPNLGEDLAPEHLASVEDERPLAVVELLDFLRVRCDPRAVLQAKGLLSNSSAEIRAAAVVYLATVDRASVDALISLAESDPDPVVRLRIPSLRMLAKWSPPGDRPGGAG